MPLITPLIKKKVEAAVVSGYKREFGDFQSTNKDAKDSWERHARIIADAVEVVITSILTEAMVAPGIPTTTGSTTGPGKIV